MAHEYVLDAKSEAEVARHRQLTDNAIRLSAQAHLIRSLNDRDRPEIQRSMRLADRFIALALNRSRTNGLYEETKHKVDDYRQSLPNISGQRPK